MIHAEMKEAPERMKNVSPTRLRSGDLANICRIYACWDGLDHLCGDMDFCRRVKTIPNGWRDLKMLLTKIANLAVDLIYTVPEEKRDGTARALQRMRYVINQGPIASVPSGSGLQVIKDEELKTLIHAAWEGNCKMCVDGNCKQCKLSKALDNMIDIDRADGSWSTIDILD